MKCLPIVSILATDVVSQVCPVREKQQEIPVKKLDCTVVQMGAIASHNLAKFWFLFLQKEESPEAPLGTPL